MKYFINCVTSNYSNFKGRARRKEYWHFILFASIVQILIVLLDESVTHYIVATALFLPQFAVTTRRLHDIGKKGLYAIPYIIATISITYLDLVVSDPELQFNLMRSLSLLTIYMLPMMCKDSQSGENQYGPNPKETPSTPQNDTNDKLVD
ncbi:MAG: DUF805 domain-containing protein [Paludibacteraceae bacterium]|nr:DUF805 domain-containing protein [Paludibacteraceae bacterium]